MVDVETYLNDDNEIEQCGDNKQNLETHTDPDLELGVYRVLRTEKGLELQKKNNDGVFENMDKVKSFENKDQIDKYLTEVMESLKTQFKEHEETLKTQSGGAKYKFELNNSERVISLTNESTNPIDVIDILKCLHFKKCKNSEGKYIIQSVDSWCKNNEMNGIFKDESHKNNKDTFLKLLEAYVNFINGNPGLLNIENDKQDKDQEKNEKEGNEVKNNNNDEVLPNDTMGGASVYSQLMGGLSLTGSGLNEFINIFRMIPNNKMRGGGNRKMFQNKISNKLTNLLNKINGEEDFSNFNNLRRTIIELNNNEKILNQEMNRMIGGGKINEKVSDIYKDYKNQLISLEYGHNELKNLMI